LKGKVDCTLQGSEREFEISKIHPIDLKTNLFEERNTKRSF
jgi:hypothetical protein